MKLIGVRILIMVESEMQLINCFNFKQKLEMKYKGGKLARTLKFLPPIVPREPTKPN